MNQNLRTYFVVGLFALQAVAVLAIILISSATLRPTLLEQMDATIDASAETAVEQTEARIARTSESVNTTSHAIYGVVIDETSDEDVENFLLTEVDVNEHVSAVTYARPDGSVVRVRYLEEDEGDEDEFYRTTVVTAGDGDPVETSIYRDDSWTEVRRTVEGAPTRDVRDLDWYKAAENGSPLHASLTGPYQLDELDVPGITVSLPVTDGATFGEGDLLGVVAFDVELTELSSDLEAKVKASEGSSLVVIDRDGLVVASRNTSDLLRAEGEGHRRVRIDELGTPSLNDAYKAAQAALPAATPKAPARVEYTSGGEPYRAVFSPLEERGDWYVVVAAPENDFLGETQAALRTNALIAVLVGLLIVVAALPLLFYLARRGERLHRSANTDVLTGLANRRHFEEMLAKQLTRAKDKGRPLSVAMLDLDHFKGINDTYGHGVGDEALVSVARHLEDSVRPDDLVARLGGDEYAVMLVGEGLDHAETVLERARANIEASPLSTNGQTVQIRITAGVADLIPGVNDGAALLRRADQALYVAKERGRNQVATIKDVDPALAEVTVPSAPVPTGAPAHQPSAPPASGGR